MSGDMDLVVKLFDSFLFPKSGDRPDCVQHRDALLEVVVLRENSCVWITGEGLHKHLKQHWFPMRDDLSPKDKREIEYLCNAVEQWHYFAKHASQLPVA